MWKLRAYLAVPVFVSLAHGTAQLGNDVPEAAPPLPATLYAVGDIMYRATSEGAVRVGHLMEQLIALDPRQSRAILAGDTCNDDGHPECYERIERTPWGPLRPLLYPVPGNHDYESARRAGGIPYYFSYMLNAGTTARGWHAFDWGGWRVIALNSEAMRRDEHNRLLPVGVEQMEWLEQELRTYARDRCVLTYYHRPMYSSGRFASPAWVGPIFRKAFKHGVDLYFTGHEHMFSALPPLTPFVDANGDARVDWTYGVPGLIGGTGGAVLFPDPRSDPGIPPERRRLKWERDGETVLAATWGITRIQLWPGGYRWAFIPVDAEEGRTYPSGGGRCHTEPSFYLEP